MFSGNGFKPVFFTRLEPSFGSRSEACASLCSEKSLKYKQKLEVRERLQMILFNILRLLMEEGGSNATKNFKKRKCHFDINDLFQCPNAKIPLTPAYSESIAFFFSVAIFGVILRPKPLAIKNFDH